MMLIDQQYEYQNKLLAKLKNSNIHSYFTPQEKGGEKFLLEKPIQENNNNNINANNNNKFNIALENALSVKKKKICFFHKHGLELCVLCGIFSVGKVSGKERNYQRAGNAQKKTKKLNFALCHFFV